MYTCSLAWITGAITDANALAREKDEATLAGLGLAADQYLDAHGYNAAAKLSIVHAYRTCDDVDDFISYLCPKGMSESKVEWLYGYILFSNPQ